jgi:hypothetical protein
MWCSCGWGWWRDSEDDRHVQRHRRVQLGGTLAAALRRCSSLSRNRTASESCGNIGPLFLFTMTSAPTKPSLDQLTLFAEASPAKTCRSRGNVVVLDLTPVPACSISSSESFAWYDPSSSSWKTWRQYLTGTWEPWSERWPRQGMTVNGHAYQLPILELGTYVIGGGQLPTPSATEYKGTCRTRFRGSEDSRMSRLVEGLRVCSTDPQVAHPDSVEILMGFPAGWTV